MAKGQKKLKLGPEAVRKLEEAFALDCSITEACYYAGISRQSYYEWTKEFPELLDKFNLQRKKPVLKARKTIVDKLGEIDTAKWYIERKRKKEFSTRIDQDITSGGEKIVTNIVTYGTNHTVQLPTEDVSTTDTSS